MNDCRSLGCIAYKILSIFEAFASPSSGPDPARLPIWFFLIVPVVHDSCAAVEHLVGALDGNRPLHS